MIVKIMLAIFDGALALLTVKKSQEIKNNFEVSVYVGDFVAFLLNIYFIWR